MAGLSREVVEIHGLTATLETVCAAAPNGGTRHTKIRGPADRLHLSPVLFRRE